MLYLYSGPTGPEYPPPLNDPQSFRGPYGAAISEGVYREGEDSPSAFLLRKANGEPWSLWSGVIHPQRLVATAGKSGLVALRSVQTEMGVPAVSSRVKASSVTKSAIPKPLRGGNSAVTPPRTHLSKAESSFPSLSGPSGTLALSGRSTSGPKKFKHLSYPNQLTRATPAISQTFFAPLNTAVGVPSDSPPQGSPANLRSSQR